MDLNDGYRMIKELYNFNTTTSDNISDRIRALRIKYELRER